MTEMKNWRRDFPFFSHEFNSSEHIRISRWLFPHPVLAAPPLRSSFFLHSRENEISNWIFLANFSIRFEVKSFLGRFSLTNKCWDFLSCQRAFDDKKRYVLNLPTQCHPCIILLRLCGAHLQNNSMILIAYSVDTTHWSGRIKKKIFSEFYEFFAPCHLLIQHFSVVVGSPTHFYPQVIFEFIFYSDCVHRMERDLMTRTDRFGVEMRERVMWDIREGVVGSDTFIPKHVVTITWKNMSFAGGIDNSLFRVSSTTNAEAAWLIAIDFPSRRIHSKWFWRLMKCTLMRYSITLTSLGAHTQRPAVIRRVERAECPLMCVNLHSFIRQTWLTLIAFSIDWL